MKENNQNSKSVPLAQRMRPSSLNDFFGHNLLIGQDSFLRKAILEDFVPSMILWGPPGSGKTTLAWIIANETKANFLELSGVSSGKQDLHAVIKNAEDYQKIGRKTILFVDEIHRWNKAQQDALLPHVERGTVILIGATTENPSFEVISALVSRSRIFTLKKLEPLDLENIIKHALIDAEKGLGQSNIQISDEVVSHIAKLANGDARVALNIIESAAEQSTLITSDQIKKILQKSNIYYDKNGEEHYNIISALHKSMRGGNADAALYWLARMLEGGEDPVYVARRLLRFASEDVGLADNFAMVLANATFDACHKLGMPECNVHLAQLVIYLARAPKSVSAYFAYGKARKDVEEFGNLPVPMHIRNAPTKLMQKLGYGKGYKYTPLEDSSDQSYMPNKLEGKRYL